MTAVLPIDDSLLPKWLSPRLLVEAPLEPDSELYEPLYEHDPNDPIALIFRNIDFNEVQSLNFISGFRGSGKTTELFRLRRRLRDDGYFVAYANALDYLLPSEPVDISDFLIVLAGSFGDALEKQLDQRRNPPCRRGIPTRFTQDLPVAASVAYLMPHVAAAEHRCHTIGREFFASRTQLPWLKLNSSAS